VIVATLTTVLLTEVEGWELVARGKVRDLYRAGAVSANDAGLPRGDEQLMFVATDRISAFDCVLPNGIPRKGEVLTQLSLFWFDLLKDIVPNHLITADVSEYPPPFRGAHELLDGRSMLVRRAQMAPVECVVRGYLSGSGWKDYKATGALCGIALPAGLRESDRLPEPIFTPATKAPTGHDINIPFSEMEAITGSEPAKKMREISLALYQKASSWAESRGIILADTKFEMGYLDGNLVLADEALTPDSSRFWPREQYAPGGPQPSFDKQFVRDYLETLDWNKQPPAPKLPEDVVEKTSAKYLEAYRLLTGKSL
jgi:phosphoribosylaminoimidazole-succinocarboxamide synthase